MTESVTIGLIQGSIRDGRFNDIVAGWTAEGLRRHGFGVVTVDPRDPALLPVQTGDAAAAEAFRTRIAPLDGYVVVTPEYNHAAPGPLKTLIDAAKAEWEAKPVGFVSYGGISGGLRAVESLRPVFAELHAVTLRDTVSFAGPWGRFDEAGLLKGADDSAQAEGAMAAFCDRLDWWARCLRAGREAVPYREKAA